MDQQIIWKRVNHPDILPGYLVSPEGYIKAEGMKDEDAITSPSYHSTNGYDFMLLNNKDGKVQLFPIDDIIAMAYIPIPESLKDKPIKVSHINGDTRDISLDNLQWVEDIEEWRVCTYPGVKPDMYEVSSWGRVRNKKTNNIVKKIYHQGYFDIVLRMQNGWKSIRHHIIIGYQYISNDINGLIINHINGDKTYNIPKNLEWVSHSMNTKHAYFSGLKQKLFKSDNPNSKINSFDAEIIYDTLIKNSGNVKKTYDELKSEIPKLTYTIVLNLKNNNSAWLTDKKQATLFKKREFVSESVIIAIAKELCDNGGNIQRTYDNIHALYPDITKSYISKIKNRYIHANITCQYF